MTNETRERIEAYKRSLPEMRERVVAVALLLVMSISMMTSATFAWLTISRHPEVTGVNTTVAANGNLEIALATSDTAPGESQVGDSSAAEGKSVVDSNITWGNLVNLSDSSYGLDNLVLRPARLNKDALLSNPLYGAEYMADGRIEKLSNSFKYTSWMLDENDNGYFGLSTQLGVRAISSTKLGATSGPVARYLELQGNADSQNTTAAGTFDSIMTNSEWMDLLAKIMGFHMCSVLEPGKPAYADKTITYTELAELKKMFDQFILAFEQEAEAMATLMNYQLYVLNGGDESKYISYSKASILNALGDSAGLKKNGTRSLSVTSGAGTAVITGIETFLYDYYMLVRDSNTLQDKLDENKTTYAWQSDDLNDVINNLVNIGQCLIKVGSEEEKTVNQFLSDFSASMGSGLGGMVGLTKYLEAECTATINNGVIYDFCKFTGATMSVSKSNSNGKTGLPITVAMYADSLSQELGTTVYATIKTNAPTPAIFTKDWNNANGFDFEIDESQMTMQAQDTYALAVDLWVRTNAESSHLTLEGNILTESHEEPKLGKNASAENVPLYTISRSKEVTSTNTETGEEETITVDTVYELYPEKYEKSAETGYLQATADNKKWYNQSSFSEFKLEEKEVPSQKWETITTVVGYEGENRIWDRDDHTNITVDSTSQGSGSCYIYYADNPEDMEQSKGLLAAMRVAFIDVNGKLLASAKMDTEHTYEENGRVIVPLVLDETTPTIGTEDDKIPYITELEKNVPMRITALVYLDGNTLSNQDVLAASEIQGQMNIQFGSSSELGASKNTDLELAERSVSASVSKAEFDYDSGEALTTNVSVLVAGEQPSTVTAFFLRKISDTQGSREKVMTDFKFNTATGMWECDYTFSAPGTYILRTVELDGQEYVLKNNPEVVVKGFNITSLTCSADLNSERSFTVMTAENSTSVDLTLAFASSDPKKMPKSVQGRFLCDGVAVNVEFVCDATTHLWKGKANFLTSGVYTLEHVVLDGNPTGLTKDKFVTADIRLGMRVRVYNNLEQKSFKFLPDEMTDEQKLLEMYVEIIDGSSKQVIGLQDAWLYYNRSDSAMRTMDTALEWDPTTNLYKGYLKTFEAADDNKNPPTEETNVGAGIWKFNRVEIGKENKITNAAVAPVFELISPDPPEVKDFINPTDYLYTPDGKAMMGVAISNSSTAQVMALMKKEVNGTITQYYVAGRRSGDEGWLFDLPKDITQDGNWTMQELYIWNYYDDDSKWITLTPEKQDGSEWTIDSSASVSQWIKVMNDWSPIDKDACMHEEKTHEMKVVQTATPVFSAGQSQDFGKTSGQVTGTFLQEYEVSDLTVDILDFEGEALQDIKEVTLGYTYGNDSEQYGNYKTDASNDEANFTITLKLNEDGRYIQEGTHTLRYAGSYTPTFKVGDKSYSGDTLLANTPVFNVWSKEPTVKITSTDPAKGTVKRVYTVKQPSSTAQAIEGDFFSYSDYRATVYIHTPASSGGYDQEAAEAYAPKVTLTLSDVPTGYTNATMLFTTNNSDSQNSTFEFEDGTATAEIGKAVTGVRGWFGVDDYPECYPAGTMTQNKINLTYGDIDFEVNLSHAITIDQPQSPTALNFTGIPESYTGARPAQVIGEGSLVTVTLPAYYWEAKIEEPKDGTWSAYSPVGEVAEVNGAKTKALSYTTWTEDGACGSTKTYYTYQYFTWTKFQSSITAATDIYKQNKKIVQWVINGKTYNAGQTIQVSGEGIINATAVVSDNGTKTFVETKSQTTYKYLYGYVAETKVTKTEDEPDMTVNIVGTPGKTESATLASPKIANVTNANAATDTLGTNTTTDSAGYANFWK